MKRTLAWSLAGLSIVALAAASVWLLRGHRLVLEFDERAAKGSA